MRPKRQFLDAQGNAPWVPVDYRGTQFGVGIGVNVSDGATLTYSIQHSFDEPELLLDCTISRAATSATARFKEAHGKVVGDSINVTGINEPNLSGVFDIASVPSDTTLTYTVSDTGSTDERARAVLFSVFENADLSGQTGKQNGNYVLPPSVIRLVITAHTDGNATANYNFLSR